MPNYPYTIRECKACNRLTFVDAGYLCGGCRLTPKGELKADLIPGPICLACPRPNDLQGMNSLYCSVCDALPKRAPGLSS